MISELMAYIKQVAPEIANDGEKHLLRGTRAGQLYVADWKTELILAGYGWNVTVGSLTAGADVAAITGGGAGTTIDSDQPELQIGIPAGYSLVPLHYEMSAYVDIDADTEIANSVLFVDLDTAGDRPIAASATVETPVNLLHGVTTAEQFPGFAASAITTDITDPVMDVLLSFKVIREADVTAAGAIISDFRHVWDASYPQIFPGPVSLYACWGGTAAVPALATLDFACVPSERFRKLIGR